MHKSVLIATPAYGGLLHSKYVMSLVASCRQLASLDIKHGLFILPNDSLVSRARNRCAAFALKNGFESILFIDADLGWKPPDLMRILGSENQVIGGTYPIKQAQHPRLVYNLLGTTVTPEEYRTSTFEELLYLREHHADPVTGELQVRHVPTGFLRIDREVFLELQDHVPAYQHESGDGGWEEHHDYFPVRPADGMYESEDWAFCSLVREHLDCGVWLNTQVVLSHTGSFTYTADMGMNPVNEENPAQRNEITEQ